jgi:folate-binding protein YgfZ
MGSEIVPGETIPAETGVVSAAVSFTKGCYPGQELVERMDSRSASAPRHVERVDVAAGAVPGDPYLVDGEQAGVVTSVAGTAALALVRRSARRDAG